MKNTKPTAFSTTPDVTDGVVYTDELLNLQINRYGTATSTNGIRGYDLDNEPDLWSNTHPRLHPAQPTCAELISRTIDMTKAVKRMDPTAETFGFVSYGFNGYNSFQNAPDWSTEQKKVRTPGLSINTSTKCTPHRRPPVCGCWTSSTCTTTAKPKGAARASRT